MRSLRAIQSAHERHLNWHEAAQDAASFIMVEELKTQVSQKLAEISPRVAETLSRHPKDDAIVRLREALRDLPRAANRVVAPSSPRERLAR